MRRLVALIGAIALTASLAGSAVGAAPAPVRPLFVGNFALLDQDGTVAGHVSALLNAVTASDLVPGTYSFYGAPGWDVRESHSVLRSVGSWYDGNHPEPGLGGSNVVIADGYECLYFTAPGDVFCHEFAVMFIDVLDPALRDDVAFTDVRDARDEWDFGAPEAVWFKVGSGAFVVYLPLES